jgi:plasmid maintenance system antidote protein VapI
LPLVNIFGNSAKVWLGLQDVIDLEEEQKLIGKEIASISPLKKNTVDPIRTPGITGQM